MSWARLSAHADRAALDFMGGVSVIAGAVSGRGFLEENYELIFDGQVRIVPWLLKIRTAEFGHLDYNNFVVAINSSPYYDHSASCHWCIPANCP